MARLKRAGINLEKEQEEMDTKARKQTLQAISNTLIEMGNPEKFSVSKVYSTLEMAPQTVYRALDQLGYHKAGHGVWAQNAVEPATQVEEAVIDFAEVEATPIQEIIVTKAPAEREFIDSKESFTIDYKDIADMTVDQMARMFAVTGLSFEIRAWR
jgi:Fe2+ or Zn2+ uptake regulation protein